MKAALQLTADEVKQALRDYVQKEYGKPAHGVEVTFAYKTVVVDPYRNDVVRQAHLSGAAITL